jgi:tetratricopeptide (TPR) repeat protein
MKDENQVFVSYGHVEEEMCKDICAYLSGNGFKPWVDTSKLQHGMLWRDEIRKGIEDSGQVVALLSAYSTRDRGVCLDEISIAVGVTGGNIHTILLQEENIINVPPTIGFEQWFDMSDWKKKKAEGDQAYNEWFKAKMDDVIRRLRDPEHVEKYGQITELRKKLNVQYAVGRQQKLLNEHYTGRKWLGKKIDAWLEDPNAPRRCLVTGAPGVGKSAFAVHYAHYNPKTAAALFFSADMPNYNDPCVVIQTLAYLLACRLSAYRRSLLWELDREDRAALAKLTESELFDKLITKPLNQSISGNHPPMCIILDGLEECGDPQKNTLAKTIARYADSLPWWLHILIVARDVPAVKNYTKNALRIEMRGEDKNNLEDIRAYYREALEEKFGSDPAWPETLEQITARSEGIFLYAKMLTSLLLDKGTLDVGGDYPEGLSEVFTLWFDWFFPDGEDYARRWRLPIGCVLGSPEPIPAQTLRRVFDWSENELADFEARLSILLRKGKNVFGDETLVFDHDFVKEWLSSGAGENFYFSSPEDGRKKMANALYAVFEEDAEELTYWEAVNLLDLPLTKKQRGKAVESLELDARVISAGECCMACSEYRYGEKIYEKGLSTAKERCKSCESKETKLSLAYYLETISDIYLNKGKITQAKKLGEKALAIVEKITVEEESDENLKNLSNLYSQMGDILKEQGKLNDALNRYQKALAIDKEQEKKNSTLQTMEAMARDYRNVGSIFEEYGNNQQAWELYCHSLEIYRKLVDKSKRFQSYEEVAKCYSCTARVLNAQNKDEAALVLHEIGMRIQEKVAQELSTPEAWETLIVSYGFIISTLNNIGRYDKSLELAYKALAICKEQIKECDTPKLRMDEASCYQNIGDAKRLQGNLNEALEMYQNALEINKKIAMENETWHLQEMMWLNHMSLGMIFEENCKIDSAIEQYKEAFSNSEEMLIQIDTPMSRKYYTLAMSAIAECSEKKADIDGFVEIMKKTIDVAERMAREKGQKDEQKKIKEIRCRFEKYENIIKNQKDKQSVIDMINKFANSINTDFM